MLSVTGHGFGRGSAAGDSGSNGTVEEEEVGQEQEEVGQEQGAGEEQEQGSWDSSSSSSSSSGIRKLSREESADGGGSEEQAEESEDDDEDGEEEDDEDGEDDDKGGKEGGGEKSEFSIKGVNLSEVTLDLAELNLLDEGPAGTPQVPAQVPRHAGTRVPACVPGSSEEEVTTPQSAGGMRDMVTELGGSGFRTASCNTRCDC